jgi:hypothetical protein
MKKLVSLFLLLIVIAVSGCATAPRVPDMHIIPTAPEPTQTAPESTQIVPGEYQNAVSIIFLDEVSMDKDIVSCLENRIEKHNPNQAFISYNKFAYTVFPDLPDREVPGGAGVVFKIFGR